MSVQMRTVGNEHFVKKDYRDCYFYYCKSLCYANQGSENYGLALANRSALLYELGDLEVSKAFRFFMCTSEHEYFRTALKTLSCVLKPNIRKNYTQKFYYANATAFTGKKAKKVLN